MNARVLFVTALAAFTQADVFSQSNPNQPFQNSPPEVLRRYQFPDSRPANDSLSQGHPLYPPHTPSKINNSGLRSVSSQLPTQVGSQETYSNSVYSGGSTHTYPHPSAYGYSGVQNVSPHIVPLDPHQSSGYQSNNLQNPPFPAGTVSANPVPIHLPSHEMSHISLNHAKGPAQLPNSPSHYENPGLSNGPHYYHPLTQTPSGPNIYTPNGVNQQNSGVQHSLILQGYPNTPVQSAYPAVQGATSQHFSHPEPSILPKYSNSLPGTMDYSLNDSKNKIVHSHTQEPPLPSVYYNGPSQGSFATNGVYIPHPNQESQLPVHGIHIPPGHSNLIPENSYNPVDPTSNLLKPYTPYSIPMKANPNIGIPQTHKYPTPPTLSDFKPISVYKAPSVSPPHPNQMHPYFPNPPCTKPYLTVRHPHSSDGDHFDIYDLLSLFSPQVLLSSHEY